MASKKFEIIKSALASRISRWYDNSKIDYGVTGKFVDAEVYGDKSQHMRIIWEEKGKHYATVIDWWTEYTAEQLYYIWMESEDIEELPEAQTKENAYKDYISMMKESWTYNRMTQEEKKNVGAALEFSMSSLHGTYKQRYSTLQAVYYGFLCGLGYSGGTWREEPERPLQSSEPNNEWSDIDPAAIQNELEYREKQGSDFVSQVMRDVDKIASVQESSLLSGTQQGGTVVMRRPKNKEERLEARKPWLAGYNVEENASADCVIATRESGGKYYLVIFDGTAANPCANYSYRTSEARQREIERHIKNRSDRIQAKEARKQAKNAKGAYVIDESKPHFKPGDLCTMKYYDDDPWEHTATIRIIKRTACFVTFAHVYGEKEEKPQRVKVSVDQNGEYLSFGSFYYFRADTIEREQKSEPAEETAITESENPATGREYIESVAASHPIQKGEPVVTIHWSECPAFQSWKENELKLSVPAADIIFKHFDKRPTDGWCYYKTKFTVDYVIDRVPGSFTDRYDLGDNIGGLIADIRQYKPELADLLSGPTSDIKVTLAPWAAGAIKAIVEQNRAKREDMLDLVELLTDEQLISAVFETDPANPNVARFFLQQLAKRDEKKALEVFRAWNSGSGIEGLI